MSRRPAAAEGGGTDAANGNSSRGVVLLVVALLLGIFILAKTGNGVAGTTRVRSTATTTATTKAGQAATTGPATTTRPPRQPADVKVLPANGSGVSGLGSKTGDRLKAKGYNVLAATNTTKDIPTSIVEYGADLEPEALAVAQALGLPSTAVKPFDSPPVSDTKGADVVVLIGRDLATSPSTAPATTAGSSATTATTAAGGRATTSTTTPPKVNTTRRGRASA